MRRLEADLWQSTIHRSGILNTHAYFLKRPAGNVLFYNTGNDADLKEMKEQGGIRYQLLTHRDESGPSLRRIRERFGSELGCSAREAPIIGRDAPIDMVFEANDRRLGDIDILHTPGHTDGSVCFFYRSPHGKSYLFTGDTFFQRNGKWATFVLSKAGGSKASLAASLLMLRDLDPDVVLSSGFVGDVPFMEVTRDEWTAAIDDHAGRLTKEA